MHVLHSCLPIKHVNSSFPDAPAIDIFNKVY
jgi:hypothetical protein